MKRKVIQLAGKTLVVSLPSKWAKQYGVKKGDEINVDDKDRNLIITTTNDLNIKQTTVDLTRLNKRAIRWVLSGLHKKGYDEIEVIYNTPDTIKLVNELIKDLFIGFAIISQTDKRCVIKSITKESETEFDAVLRRAFLVTLTMGENMLDLIQKNKLADLQELSHLEKTNNQLTNFCERNINKRGYNDNTKNSFLYVTAWNLEKIADEYKYICEYLSKKENQKTKIGKNTINLFKDVNQLFREFYELFYSFDMVNLNKVNSHKDDIQQNAFRLLKTADSNERIVINNLLNIMTRSIDFSASLVALNQ